MTPEPATHRRVVVDGSNIATEGRATPSLAQLDEAIRAFLEEFRGFRTSDVTVVVDATFGHRIDASEVPAFEEAVAHGEMVTPPAGAIGRGDAFILRVAEKAGALVLSNDSFQEFHAERPWLFEDGRLIGGKPVPGIGWIFTPRTPVRGATSRAVTKKAKGTRAGAASGAADGAPDDAPSDAGQPPGTAPTSGRRRGARGGRSKLSATADAPDAGDPDGGPPTAATPARKATKATKARKATKAGQPGKAPPAAAEGEEPVPAPGSLGGTTADAGIGVMPGPAVKATRAAKAAAKVAKTGQLATPAKTPKAGMPAKAAKATTAAKATKASKVGRQVVEAGQVDGAAADAAVPGRPAPPALNDPLTFLSFVSEHRIGAAFDGVVSGFTSHGAHVDVGAMRCHVPLRGLGDPPPARARAVLSRGETRRFVLVSLDAPGRRAEVALAPEERPSGDRDDDPSG